MIETTPLQDYVSKNFPTVELRDKLHQAAIAEDLFESVEMRKALESYIEYQVMQSFMYGRKVGNPQTLMNFISTFRVSHQFVSYVCTDLHQTIDYYIGHVLETFSANVVQSIKDDNLSRDFNSLMRSAFDE